ncbi:hypothetical protein O0I10_000268 [Lichtheimia ornata]|uniref:BRCT domain-containing protein n=1 Tax=Lichtheimia ornata TaxID=688661 RepID=A0AAD8DJV4_9FUNG|nr:uncharacterized protein O0I10_000268 [Lichtheimia ornata]KAJ8663992.1 hypothetical protein O0I10_000268 [Lichtheimia ornata]
MSQTTKRRSIRFGKEGPAASIRTGSKSTSDLRQLSLNSFLKTHDSLSMPATASSRRVTDHSPSQKKLASPKTTPASPTPDHSQLLKGVVACLDIRTEDGDDVSENFERALQSMGAKTRRTFSDSVTHLVFKNGSNATLKKALSKKIHIVNLLWITRCKREGRRLEEKEFLIESPQGIVLAGKKRRKSMEPGKVKALNEEEASDKRKRARSTIGGNGLPSKGGSTLLQQQQQRHSSAHEYRPSTLSQSLLKLEASTSNSTTDSSNTNTTDKSTSNSHEEQQELDEVAERVRRELEGEDIDLTPPASPVLSRPHLSTAALERQQQQQQQQQQEQAAAAAQAQKPVVTKEMRERNEQIKAQIKADFFVGDTAPPPVKSSRQSLGSSNTTPLRRKRRSLGGNLSRPNLSTSSSSSSTTTASTNNNTSTTATTTTATAATATPMPPPSQPQPPQPKPSQQPQPSSSSLSSSKPATIDGDASSSNSAHTMKTRSSNPKPTIVMTSMSKGERDRCAAAIKRMGVYEVATTVDERTTHVIVGKRRRTVSVLYGLLFGAWLVKPTWIFDSERNKEYLSESEYEVIDYYPDAPRARQQKPFLPSNLDIFVHSAHILDTNSIKTLIHKAKGRTVDDISQADLIISKHPLETTNKMTINENWILDCIERWRYLPTEPYSIKKKTNVT